MRVLGVDPGIARTGVAVVDGHAGALALTWAGCVETSPASHDAARLARLFEELAALVALHRPDVGAVEELFFASNRLSAMRVSEARGVALCALARAGLDVAAYTPPQVKEAVAGWGGAPKQQVGTMTRALLGVGAIGGPDDVADACAVAVCHHHRAQLAGRTDMRRSGARPAAVSPRLAQAVARARAMRESAGR